MSRFRNLTTALAALMLAATPSLHAVELQSVAGTDTKLSVYGFVWAYANYYVDAKQQQGGYAGSLFYNGVGLSGDSVSPLDTHTLPDKQLIMAVQPTRFGFASATPSANLGDIKTKIEYDLNGSSSHLRLAQIQVGGWTIGQAWSLWNDFDAGVDTVDWAGPIGSACFDTPRYKLVRYDGKIDKNSSFGVSFEQNGGQGDGAAGSGGAGDAKVPTIIGAYTYSDDWGHIALRAMAQNYGTFIAADPTATPAVVKTRYSKEEAAFMLSGDVKIAKDDLVYSIYTGNAVGNYGTGFQAADFNDTTQSITAYKSIGWTLGYTHNWTDAVRSNIVVSGTSFSSDSALPATDSTTGTAWKSGNSLFLNTFVKLAKNLEFGAEYIYEQAKPFATNGAIDGDGKAASKNSNSKIEVSLKANF
jgi:hypothetical protein